MVEGTETGIEVVAMIIFMEFLIALLAPAIRDKAKRDALGESTRSFAVGEFIIGREDLEEALRDGE